MMRTQSRKIHDNLEGKKYIGFFANIIFPVVIVRINNNKVRISNLNVLRQIIKFKVMTLRQKDIK
jgi:hypothetical protein